MNKYKEILNWFSTHKYLCVDFLRIYIGAGLAVRGYIFLHNTTLLEQTINDNLINGVTMLSAHYIILTHLIGGGFMCLGLMTRVATLFQVPILFGAVFFVHLKEGFYQQGQSLEFTALVLFLLCLIFLFGSGRVSLDYYLFKSIKQKGI